jgi:hypothetical protein
MSLFCKEGAMTTPISGQRGDVTLDRSASRADFPLAIFTSSLFVVMVNLSAILIVYSQFRHKFDV